MAADKLEILYVAKHDSGDNDDEGAILFALRELGHAVTPVHEIRKHRTPADTDALHRPDYDLCLFHKWADVNSLKTLKVPKAFWYFDMVVPVDNDPTLAARGESRRRWMEEVAPACVAGFLTDGDYVVNSGRDNLFQLSQGFDERNAGGIGSPIPGYAGPDILFAGMVNHGRKRAEHVARLQARYGDRFGVLGDGGPRYRKHGKALADVFASTKIVVSPDGPATDRYWSNRVYLTLGLGGFLLHPFSRKLRDQYAGSELRMYQDRDFLEALIDHYLDRPNEISQVREAGHRRTMLSNLYRHRCEDLIHTVKERL
ncbi:MAG: glycosyltransferase family protein [Fimbriiglobus sp.]